MEPARIIDDYFFVMFSLFGVVTSWIMFFSMFSTFHIPQLASGICPFLVCWRSPEDKNLLEEESVRHFELLTNDHGWPPRSFHGMLKWSVWKCLNLQERHRERAIIDHFRWILSYWGTSHACIWICLKQDKCEVVQCAKTMKYDMQFWNP